MFRTSKMLMIAFVISVGGVSAQHATNYVDIPSNIISPITLHEPVAVDVAIRSLVSHQNGIPENYLNARVFFAYDLQNVTVSETVRKMREYRIPISFIQSEESTGDSSKRLNVKVKDRTLREFLLDIVSQAKGYKFGMVENHLILYPAEKKYESIVDVASIGTRTRSIALSEFVFVLKAQIQDFDNLSRPVRNGYFDTTLWTEPATLPQKTTILKGFMWILGKDPRAVLSINSERWRDGTDHMRIRLDLIKTLKEDNCYHALTYFVPKNPAPPKSM